MGKSAGFSVCDNVHGFTPLESIRLLTGQAGKELDAETGLNYFCQRYYDSQIGRFVSLDPVDDKSGGSPYAYCSNNPLKFTDPTGEVKSSAQIEEMFQIYNSWKSGQPDLWSTFASWPGSMASYMRAHPEFYEIVRLNEFISQMRFYFAKHNYFRETHTYGTTTIEMFQYFNPITMTVMIGMSRYENPELVAGSGAGMGSTYTPEVELSLMNQAYLKFMQANYPLHGSTLVPAYLGRYIAGDQSIWTCADWSYELNYVFESMRLQFWQTTIKNFGIHSVVMAVCEGYTPRYYDPWFAAPCLWGFQVFPPR